MIATESSMQRLFIPITISVFLGACSSDNVLFVTATSIGINADTTTQSASIGYDRVEGVIAPVYDDGEAPPVYARLESDLSIFNPQIAQVYATGDAALIAVRRAAAPKPFDPAELAQDDANKADYNPPPQALAVREGNKKRVMVFATGTLWGLEATYRSNALASMSLGYKRSEASYIPIMSQSGDDKGESYASVLAAINLASTTATFADAGLKTSSFFATGEAAKQVAAREDIYKTFRDDAESGVNVKAVPATADMRAWKDCQSSKSISAVDLEAWIDAQTWEGPKPSRLALASDPALSSGQRNAVKHFCP